MKKLPRVLIVEDESAIAELIAVNLRHNGFQPVWAADGEAAQRELDAVLPDVILLDWMLPGQSGLALSRKWRADARTKMVPILMLTARGDEPDKIAGLDAGADVEPQPAAGGTGRLDERVHHVVDEDVVAGVAAVPEHLRRPALQQRLQRINIRVPAAPMPVDVTALTTLFHLDAFRLDEVLEQLPSFLDADSPAGLRRGGGSARGFYRHDDDIASFVLQHPGEVDSALMAGFVEELLLRQGPALLRYKGVLALRGDERRVVLQGVHRLSGSDYGAPWSEGEQRHTTLVLIGRNLDEDGIRNAFRLACR